MSSDMDGRRSWNGEEGGEIGSWWHDVWDG